MQITIKNTDRFVEINGVPARVWEGRTERGIAIHCFVTRVAVLRDEDCSEFERELTETPGLKSSESWPLRMTL